MTDMDPWGFAAAVGGMGTKLIGGKMESDAANKAARLNAIAQANENQFAREYNERMTREAWAREESIQREFAKSGIQWRAADARAAGIHPLAAMGAQTHSFSSSVGAPQYQPGQVAPFAGKSMGSAVSDMGQDISRAIQATRKEDDRVEAYNMAVQTKTLAKMDLENQILASQLGKLNSAQVGPSMPSPTGKRMVDGQGQTAPRGPAQDLSGTVKAEPMKVTGHNPNERSQEPAPVTDTGYAATRTGYFPMPTKDVKERIEDNFWQETMHFARNNILPMVSNRYFNPPAESPGEGREWYYDPFSGYRTRKRRSSSVQPYLPEVSSGYKPAWERR